MIYPRIVYHKDYKPDMEEKVREYHTRLAKSEEHHKELGPDWGEHPALKKSEPKSELKLDIKPEPKVKASKVKAE